MSYVERARVEQRHSPDLGPSGLLLAWLYLVLLGGTWAVLSSFTVRLLSVILFVAVVGFWLARTTLRKRPIVTGNLERPLTVLLLAATVATILSISPRVSAETLVLYGAYCVLFLFLVAVARSHREDLFRALIASTVAVSIVSLGEPLLWYLGLAPGLGYAISWPDIASDGALFPPVWPRPGFVTGNPNVLAGLLAPWLGIALHMTISAANRSGRRLGAIWFIVLAFALLSTVSRGGLLAASAGIAFVAVATWSMRHRAHLVRRLGGRRPKVILSAIAVSTVPLAAWQVLPSAGVGAGSAGVRVELWGYALQMVAQRPLFGLGPDTFGLALLRFQSPMGRPEDFLPHAHNLYLGIAAETGIVGLLAVLWLAYSIWMIWWQSRPVAEDESALGRWVAPMAALVVMAFHGLVEDFRIYPLLVVQAMVFVALIVGSVNSRAEGQHILKGRWLVLPVVLLVLPTAYTTFTRWEVDRAANSVAAGQWNSAQPSIATAADHDPAMGFYTGQSALARGWLASFSGNRSDLFAAIAEYRRAIASEPLYALNHANLAALLWQDGQREEAIDEMRHAVALRPAQIHFRFALATYLDRAGDCIAADQLYVSLIREYPSVVQSPAWRSLVSKTRESELIDAVVSEINTSNPLLRGSIAMAAGDAASAASSFEEAVAAQPNEFAAWWNLGLAFHKLGRLGDSEQALRQAVSLSPRNVEARADLAAVLLDGGHLRAATQQASASIFEQPNSTAHLVLAKLAQRQGREDEARQHYEFALPRIKFDLSYGLIAWRRPGLPIDTLPQLPLLLSTRGEEDAFGEYARHLASVGEVDRANRVLARWMAYDRWAETDVRVAREQLVGSGGSPPS